MCMCSPVQQPQAAGGAARGAAAAPAASAPGRCGSSGAATRRPRTCGDPGRMPAANSAGPAHPLTPVCDEKQCCFKSQSPKQSAEQAKGTPEA